MDTEISQTTKINIASDANNDARKNLPTTAEIQNWLVSYLANLVEVNPDEIDITVPFDSYDLDSSAAVELSGELEDWLGINVSPTLLYDYPTVKTLAQYLSEGNN